MTDQTRVVCVILPNKKQLDITVKMKSRAREIISQLCELLDIKKLHLFGLCLQKDNHHLFLDLENKLSMYFPKEWRSKTLQQERIVLHLKAHYYIGNVRLITEEKIRTLYYADLKGQVLSSQCYGQEGQYFQLAAYALQVDLGDWREKEGPYFSPHEYFPPWILMKHGCDYVLQHTPVLHKELLGVCVCDAVLLFIQEACRLCDVPLTFYSMSKEKKEQKSTMLLGLALSGLHVYKMVSGERQLLYEFIWSNIHHITFQGRRFEIRSDVLAGSKLVLYTCSTLHSQHLLKHMRNNHRLFLQAKQLPQQTAGKRQYREVCIRDKTDPDTEESEDELPPVKSLLDKARKLQAKLAEPVSDNRGEELLDVSSKGMYGKTVADNEKSDKVSLQVNMTQYERSDESDEIELCVDEPEEMFVDDPDEIMCLAELLDEVSVDGPLLPVSHWIGITMEMKHVLKWRTCSLYLDHSKERLENLHLLDSCSSSEENIIAPTTTQQTQEATF